MARFLVGLISAGLGGALGLLIDRLSFRPLFRGIAAMLMSWLLASLITNWVWFLLAAEPNVTGAVSVGMAESLITSLLVVIVGGIVYLVLGWLGSAILPALVTKRTMVMGLLGGLTGSLIAICNLPAGQEL